MATQDAEPRRARQIDDLEEWGGNAPVGLERDIPGYPWMGDLRPLVPPYDRDLRTGATWVVCADLVAELKMDHRPSIVSLRALRSMIRYRGRPVDAMAVSSLEGFWEPLILIPAGTRVEVETISGSVMWDFGDDLTRFIRFVLPSGQRFVLTTAESHGHLWLDDALAMGKRKGEIVTGMSWAEIACAAVVVPASHPNAADPVALEAILARIADMATESHTLAAREIRLPDRFGAALRGHLHWIIGQRLARWLLVRLNGRRRPLVGSIR